MFDASLALTEAALLCQLGDQKVGALNSIKKNLAAVREGTELPMNKISPILHYVFAKFPAQQSAIIAIITILERLCDKGVTEACAFDFLVARGIAGFDRRIPGGDREELVRMSLEYVEYVLSLKRNLSMSILRSLVAFCETGKGTDNEAYMTTVLGYLCEACVLCANAERVPEIGSILIAATANGHHHVSKFIVYALEAQLSIAHTRGRFDCILAPLFPSKTIASRVDRKVICQAQEGIVKLLQTWPGMFRVGIQNNIISSLLIAMPEEPSVVIEIFTGILKLNGVAPAITDPFCGLFLAILLEEDLIPKLRQVTESRDAVKFLHLMFPYSVRDDARCETRTVERNDKTCGLSSTHIQTSMLLDMAMRVNSTRDPVSALTAEKMIKLGHMNWDWTILLILFTAVLPYDAIEARGVVARNVYSGLFKFFSETFLNLPTPGNGMIEPFCAMLTMLMGYSQWGSVLISDHLQFTATLADVMSYVQRNREVKVESPHRLLLKCLGVIVEHEIGQTLLRQMKHNDKSLWQRFMELCEACACENTCTIILDILSFDGCDTNVMPCVQCLLTSSNFEVYETVISKLRNKQVMKEEQFHSLLTRLIIPAISMTCRGSDNDVRLIQTMHLAGELLMTGRRACDMFVTQRGSWGVDDILRRHSHFILALLMSNETMLDVPWIDEEIEWWIQTGNHQYVALYDKAVACSFSGELQISQTNEPAIVDLGGTAPAPPHLFRSMAQTARGVAKLIPHVEQLMRDLDCEESDLQTRRALLLALGHFCSSPIVESHVERLEIPEKLFKAAETTSSLVMKGALIVALSMCHESQYFVSLLRKRTWRVFRFGMRRAVIPVDVVTWLGELTHVTSPPNDHVPELTKCNAVTEDLKRMSNTLQSRKAAANLMALKKAGGEAFDDPEIAHYAHQLMTSCYYDPTMRSCIYSIFASVPLLRWDLPTASPDTQDSAEMSASLHLAGQEKYRKALLSAIPLLQASVPSLRAMDPLPRCPEVFLSDTDLRTLTSCSRRQFYEASVSEQQRLRAAILGTAVK